MAYIEFTDVVRTYGEGGAKINALDGASFSVEKGELAVILGQSGAGKTTALNILGGMDSATSGTVVVDGRDISHATERIPAHALLDRHTAAIDDDKVRSVRLTTSVERRGEHCHADNLRG